MNIFHLAKRGFLPLLVFIPLSAFSVDLNLYEDKVWQSLLHLDKNDKPAINTSSFLSHFMRLSGIYYKFFFGHYYFINIGT
jgi:hypothetical protein